MTEFEPVRSVGIRTATFLRTGTVDVLLSSIAAGALVISGRHRHRCQSEPDGIPLRSHASFTRSQDIAWCRESIVTGGAIHYDSGCRTTSSASFDAAVR